MWSNVLCFVLIVFLCFSLFLCSQLIFSFTEQLCWSHLRHFVHTFAATARDEEENFWRFLALYAQLLLPPIKIKKSTQTKNRRRKEKRTLPVPRHHLRLQQSIYLPLYICDSALLADHIAC
jgi:hypothetical protein